MYKGIIKVRDSIFERLLGPGPYALARGPMARALGNTLAKRLFIPFYIFHSFEETAYNDIIRFL